MAELSKLSTRSVQWLSQQNENRIIIPYRFICFNEKKKQMSGNETIPWGLFRKYLVISLIW